MKTYTIKTTTGDRYETDDVPLRIEKAGVTWLYFDIRNGVGTKFINVAHIVSVTEREGEEEWQNLTGQKKS